MPTTSAPLRLSKQLTICLYNLKPRQTISIDGELAADLVGDYLFTDIDFVRNLKAGNRNLFQRVFDEIKHLVKLATAGSKEARELEKVKKLFEDVYREAGTEKSNAKDGGVKYSLVGRTAEGFGIYKTNYPLNTPKKVKQTEIISLIQNVWSNNPIKLTIVENGEYADITAKFNPELGERSDLAKIAFGNRKGNGQEKRMTLDLGSDLYQIAEEAKFSYSKEAIPKPNNPAHDGVTKYHYFVTNIVYKDNDGNYVPCHMNIDVKRNAEGDWFYSFAIEKGSVPQALLAAGTDNSATLPSGIVTDPEENVNQKLSPSSDNAYLRLVDEGDTKAAQKLVDAAAKEAGYTVKAYHGTDAGEFHEFDKGRIGEASGLSILGDGFYFSDRESTARQYGKNVFPVYLKQLNPYNATAEDAYKLNALELERQGYDSVILQTGKGKVLMVLDPNQVKSAEPITYDDKGNVIPLSERFNPKSNDMRYSLSPEADRAYMDAVENANMDAAQVMVDEAAKQAGFTEEVYHGTRRGFGFTKYDPSKSNAAPALFTSGDLAVARTYSQDDGVTNISLAQELGLTAGNYRFFANTDGMIEIYVGITYFHG